MDQKHWIFISSHFDDVALSCGGLVWDLARQGHQVEIWTLMGGFPPDADFSEFAHQNHLSWGMSGENAIRIRRAEDKAACEVLHAQPRHFDWPDVIYRRDSDTGKPIVNTNEELFGIPPEESLVKSIQQVLEHELPQESQVVFPIGLGNHIDHLAVSRAGKIFEGRAVYYVDYPYILKVLDFPFQPECALKPEAHPLGQEALAHWQDAVLCYQSQLHTFWHDNQEARLALRNYQAGGGGRLWKKPAI